MKSRWIVCCVLCMASPVRAALLLNEVLDRMERNQSQLEDVSFDFVERIHQGDFPEQRVSGKVQARKPHSLRVEQTAPEKLVLVTRGETVSVYMPAQKQQLTGDWKAWVRQSRFPLPLIDFLGTFTPERWRSHYKVFFGGYDHHLYELRFKPLNPGELPVTLWISDDTFLPARGRMDDNGSQVELDLNGVRPNTHMDPALFVPTVPDGTAIVPIKF